MNDPYYVKAYALLIVDFPICEMPRFEAIVQRVADALREAEREGRDAHLDPLHAALGARPTIL